MAKKLSFIILFIFLFASMVDAQTFERYKRKYRATQQRHGQFSLMFGYGTASYYGDLKEPQAKIDSEPSVVIGVEYRVLTHLSLRSTIQWYRLEGADINNPVESTIRERNLSFQADNFEFSLLGVLYLLPRYRTNPNQSEVLFNPYIVGGFGVTSNNPTAEYQGYDYNLRSLQTEGVKYGAVLPIIPLGIGVSIKVNDKFDISLEGTYRVTFSDYLDDVSLNRYLPLESFSNPVAAALSDRRPELGLAPAEEYYHRGNPDRNDTYFILSIKGQYYFRKPNVMGRRFRKAKGR